MVIFTGIVCLLLLVRLVIAIINWQTKPLHKYAEPQVEGRIAILIPARNEAQNLPELLTDLQGLKGVNAKIYVLDDHSTDTTKRIAESFQCRLPNMKIIEGSPLPEGWMGKQWACHQLAQEAEEDYLLFLDADVRIDPQLVPKAVNLLKNKDLALFSIFPRQIMKTFGEKLVVPSVYYILVTLLPLRMVEKVQNSALSAANGQFMLFDGNTYRKQEWHRIVKQSTVEDMAIMQEVKKQGFQGMVEISRDFLRCRMYSGFREAVNGFSKNFKYFFGGSWVLTVLFLLFGTAGLWLVIPVYYQVSVIGLAVEFAVLRPVVAITVGFGIFEAVVLGPLQMATTIYLGIVAFLKSKTKRNQWKGRPIS